MTDPRRRHQDARNDDRLKSTSTGRAAPDRARPRDEPPPFYPWPNPAADSADDIPHEGD